MWGQSHLLSPPLSASCLSGGSGLGQGVVEQAAHPQGWQAMTQSKPATFLAGVAAILQLMINHWWSDTIWAPHSRLQDSGCNSKHWCGYGQTDKTKHAHTLGGLAGVTPAIMARGILSSSGVSATCCWGPAEARALWVPGAAWGEAGPPPLAAKLCAAPVGRAAAAAAAAVAAAPALAGRLEGLGGLAPAAASPVALVCMHMISL